MFACADMSTILLLVIRITELLRERHSRIFRMTGFARYAEWARMHSSRQTEAPDKTDSQSWKDGEAFHSLPSFMEGDVHAGSYSLYSDCAGNCSDGRFQMACQKGHATDLAAGVCHCRVCVETEFYACGCVYIDWISGKWRTDCHHFRSHSDYEHAVALRCDEYH